MLSENEKRAAMKEAAKLGADYYKALVDEGVDKTTAASMANYTVLMYLSSMDVIKFDPPDEKKDWEK